MLTVYGIKNCDTVKKARAWLEQNQVEYRFHDYKVDGISPDLLNQFAAKIDRLALVNKRSTTWRNLTDAQKNELNAENVLPLLLEHPTLIKRPIVMSDTLFLIGFAADEYQNTL